MTKRPEESEFEYKYLFLDVKGMQLLPQPFRVTNRLNKGHPRLFLENTDVHTGGSSKGSKGGKRKFLGIQWGW
jgi:hypothetical protein